MLIAVAGLLLVAGAVSVLALRDPSERAVAHRGASDEQPEVESREKIPHRAVGESEIAQAYHAIPHRRTQYAPSRSNLEPDESKRLAELFRWVDYGVVARVGALEAVQSRSAATSRIKELKAVASQIAGLALPSQASPVARMIVDALDEQSSALEKWQARGVPPSLANDPRVRRSSQLLRGAYQRLRSTYATETEHNKRAFFDHLCALDFI